MSDNQIWALFAFAVVTVVLAISVSMTLVSLTPESQCGSACGMNGVAHVTKTECVCRGTD